jgi:hypothetical protein
VKGEAGEETMPFGSQLRVTVTGPVNPLPDLTERITGSLVPPTLVETEEGVTERAKSPGAGGAEPRLHAARPTQQPRVKRNRNLEASVSGNWQTASILRRGVGMGKSSGSDPIFE